MNGLLAARISGVRLKTRDIQTAQIADKPLQILEIHLQLGGNFRLCRIASQPRLAIQYRLLHASSLPPQRTRPPIHLAQAVENRSPNAKPGIMFQPDFLVRIKFAHRIY